jgi:hypothetical protein
MEQAPLLVRRLFLPFFPVDKVPLKKSDFTKFGFSGDDQTHKGGVISIVK